MISNDRQPGRAHDNSPPIYRWRPVRQWSESRRGRKITGASRAGFFRPCGAWTSPAAVFPAMNRWAIFGSPYGTKGSSPPIHRWGPVRQGRESRQGRKIARALRQSFFRPCGAWASPAAVFPAINRWAIFGCPCGTNDNSPPIHRRATWPKIEMNPGRDGRN